MAVRFFEEDTGNGRRLLIGIAHDEEPVPPGQKREAVREATGEDIAVYHAEYQAYVDTFAEAEPTAKEEPLEPGRDGEEGGVTKPP